MNEAGREPRAGDGGDLGCIARAWRRTRPAGPELVLLAIAAAADTTSVIFRGTIVLVTTPDEFRGRVTAADYVVGTGGAPLGSLEAGAVAWLTTPAISAISGGLATVAGVLLIRLAFPAIARYNARAESSAAQDGASQDGTAQD